MKKTFKTCLALALALVLCLGLGTTAFADDVSVSNEAAVTKELQMPAGTVTPTATFEFNVVAVSADGYTDTAAIPRPSFEAITVTGMEGTTEGSLKKVVATSDVTLPAYTHAGVYVYTVTEAENTVTAANGETYTYSDASYTMTVYVVNGTNGPEVGNIVVENGSTKVDATPDENDTGNGKATGNDFRFVNTFTKMSGTEVDPDPDIEGDEYFESLKVTKEVTGNMGDKTAAYSFSLTVTKTALEETGTYDYDIVDADGEVLESGSISSGAALSFTLKHTQSIVVKNLLVGTAYTVTENLNNDNYAVTMTDGTTTTTNKTFSGTLTDTRANVGVENKYDYTDPITGVIIDNLPFVMLVVVAAAGIAFFFVSRRRREQEG